MNVSPRHRAALSVLAVLALAAAVAVGMGTQPEPATPSDSASAPSIRSESGPAPAPDRAEPPPPPEPPPPQPCEVLETEADEQSCREALASGLEAWVVRRGTLAAVLDVAGRGPESVRGLWSEALGRSSARTAQWKEALSHSAATPRSTEVALLRDYAIERAEALGQQRLGALFRDGTIGGQGWASVRAEAAALVDDLGLNCGAESLEAPLDSLCRTYSFLAQEADVQVTALVGWDVYTRGTCPGECAAVTVTLKVGGREAAKLHGVAASAKPVEYGFDRDRVHLPLSQWLDAPRSLNVLANGKWATASLLLSARAEHLLTMDDEGSSEARSRACRTLGGRWTGSACALEDVCAHAGGPAATPAWVALSITTDEQRDCVVPAVRLADGEVAYAARIAVHIKDRIVPCPIVCAAGLADTLRRCAAQCEGAP